MSYFPEKPWNIGDEFENETTGVVYRYDGTKWVATSDSDPDIEYLPITGGEITGPLLVNNLLEVHDDRVEYQKNRTSIQQMTSREIINAGILDNLMRAPNDGYLKGLATEEYVDDAISNIPTPSNHIPGTGRYQFNERGMEALRPGECCLYTARSEPTSTLAEARGLCWKGVDYNGNRPAPDQNAIAYAGYASECVILSDGGLQMLYRINGGSHVGKDYCVLSYDKSIDTYFLGWGEECGVATSTSVSFHPSKILIIKKPELFT